MTGSLGPAAVIDVSHPGLRATPESILALSQNLLGLAGGPFLMGALADVYGLRLALSLVHAFSLLAGRHVRHRRAPISPICRASSAASRVSPDSTSKRRELRRKSISYHPWLATA